jgi:hypothetical protein
MENTRAVLGVSSDHINPLDMKWTFAKLLWTGLLWIGLLWIGLTN